MELPHAIHDIDVAGMLNNVVRNAHEFICLSIRVSSARDMLSQPTTSGELRDKQDTVISPTANMSLDGVLFFEPPADFHALLN